MTRAHRMLMATAAAGLGWAPRALACPGCKDALVEPARLGMARGFAWSIGLLLVVPLVLVTTVAWQLAQAARQHKEG